MFVEGGINTFSGQREVVRNYLEQGALFQEATYLLSLLNRAQTVGLKNVSITEIQLLLQITQQQFSSVSNLEQNLAQNKLQTENQINQNIPNLFRAQQ